MGQQEVKCLPSIRGQQLPAAKAETESRKADVSATAGVVMAVALMATVIPAMIVTVTMSVTGATAMTHRAPSILWMAVAVIADQHTLTIHTAAARTAVV